jgi:hypothetical protein
MLPFFEWFERSLPGSTIRGSLWLFPAIESLHLLALALIGGCLILINLRLSGLGLRSQPVAQLTREIQPWLIGGLVVMVTSGILLFTAEAVKCYYSPAFWTKMTFLVLSLVFTFTIWRRIAVAPEERFRPIRSKLAALISMLLWSVVGAAGRWIGFSD